MDINTFITRWSEARGGAERANYQMFLSELCEALDLPRPDPASDDTRTNDYVFERGVKRRESEGFTSTLRIDLYKRGCFILEAKQSRATQRDDQTALFKADEAASTAAAEGKWDVLMRNARKQAEDYAFRLPADHPAPPFIIVCDVGYVFEVYADFSGSGRAYGHFPDRKGFRIRLEDLRDEKVVKRLRAIWTDPQTLDPTRESARVTRDIAKRLAEVSKRLEGKYPADEVALFLMRCIFTMFAEDVDLLPKGKFTELLKERLDAPDSFAPMLIDLWRKMDAINHADRFYSGFGVYLKHFNGGLFKDAKAFPLAREDIGELIAAASHNWRYVEPAIFGTLVEQALDPRERHQLGAHYTPRSYVERLVEVTVMEPLRADWNAAQLKAGDAKERGDLKGAVAAVRVFKNALCSTRVLDPACGTGNFLYVSLELMKRLEGEVLEALAELGETEGIGLEEVDPHQFLGIELNVRAAAIAELVLWIGYLQQHYRNRPEHPQEPILQSFKNINFGLRSNTGAPQKVDAVLTWDGFPEDQFEMRDGLAVQIYPNGHRRAWPEAEFIVGNPPFLGGKDIRDEHGTAYTSALRKSHKAMNDSADFVMYWWDYAADQMMRKKSVLRRFGFVTTNSITQVFSRKAVARWLSAKNPLSIVYAINDHPWRAGGKDVAVVRISMTVAAPGVQIGRLDTVVSEAGIETDDPEIIVASQQGRINSDLTVGADVTRAKILDSNKGLSSPGVKLHGKGFIVTKAEAKTLGLASRPNLEKYIREYRNGRDLTAKPRNKLVIDLFGLTEADVRVDFPEVYQHLASTVRVVRKEGIDKALAKGNVPTSDSYDYLEKWWLFGKPRPELRPGLDGLIRYIVTVETSEHRFFQFLPDSVTPDNRLICFASDDASLLAMLSAKPHLTWTSRSGGSLEDRPTYTKTVCFDPFPFPDPDEAARIRLRVLGEELDATRKTVQAEHSDLTLTGLYNVLEKVRAGAALSDAEVDVMARGRVLILKDLHDQIDRATADAYGWPHDLTDEQILEKLVALNGERTKEEAAGHVRWLRPDYQISRFAKGAAAQKTGQLDLGADVVVLDKGLSAFPKDKGEQVMAIRAVLQAFGRPMDAAAVSRSFKGGGRKIEQRVVQALNTLVRYAEITALPDGTYAAKRAA